MGLAALAVVFLLVAVLGVAIVYGFFIGIVRGSAVLWRFLVGGSEEKVLSSPPCWETNRCPETVREKCPAHLQWAEKLPCWLTNLTNEGRLRVNCLTCPRFSVTDLAA